MSDNSGTLTVGKLCPDINLSNIKYFKTKQASIKNFRGKWLILDFWSEYCSSCIGSFPKINKFRKEYSEEVEFIMIGIIRKNPQTIESLYEKCKTKFDLALPVVYDSSLHKKFNIEGLPYIVIIDPTGIVHAITNIITSEQIDDLVTGKRPKFSKTGNVYQELSKNYNYELPLLAKGNGGNDDNFLSRSVLTSWNELIPKYYINTTQYGLEILGVDLKTLYRFAYTGNAHWINEDSLLYENFYINPILEVSDKSIFSPDEAQGKNLFCYSARVNNIAKVNSNPTRFVEKLKHDLNDYFPYNVCLELRQMPCFKLTIQQGMKEKLKSLGGEAVFLEPNGPGQGILIRNRSIQNVISNFYLSIGFPREIPIINETGIDYNIDLRIDAIYFDDWIKELEKKGFILTKSTKEMKVIVIRDAI